jgi:hypothetical protein
VRWQIGELKEKFIGCKRLEYVDKLLGTSLERGREGGLEPACPAAPHMFCSEDGTWIVTGENKKKSIDGAAVRMPGLQT